MLRLRVKLDASCAKHPEYDPAREGIDGIEDGCKRCNELYVLCQSAKNFETAAKNFLNPPVASSTS